MAYLEGVSFCGLQEYNNGLSSRVDESALQVDELYMLMVQLSGGQREAGKQTIRLLEIGRETGKTIVTIAFLDDNLESQWGTTEDIEQGIMHGFDGTVFIDVTNDQYLKINEAYMRDYFDDQFGGFLEANDGVLAGV